MGGKANGVQLLSPASIDLIFQEQANGTDQVLGVPLRWGIGFGLPQPETFPYIPDERICFWGGWGGSMIVMNPDRRTTFAYVMNKMGRQAVAGIDPFGVVRHPNLTLTVADYDGLMYAVQAR